MNTILAKHPCFDSSARHSHARVHLPVAAGCNIQCNYCDRKGDCVNESRPGVTSALLSPRQALDYLEKVRKVEARLSVVGIAGPGDPFAHGETTMETLELVSRHHPDLLLCLASNGMGILPYVDELARMKVSHVTLTINALEPAIAARIYSWVRRGKSMLRGTDAAEALVQRQAAALAALTAKGITVKVNTIVIPGVNEHHVVEVARAAAKAGVSVHNLMPLYPVAGTPFAEVPTPDKSLLDSLRAQCGELLPQMRHCTRCRADAVGLLGQPMTEERIELLQLSARGPRQERPYLAVASREGVMVNQHLGDAASLWIFGIEGGIPRLVEKRLAPERGGGDARWRALADTLKDCSVLVTSGAGAAPTRVLGEAGIAVSLADCLVEEAVTTLLNGKSLRAPVRQFRCGDGCSGRATGCG